MIIPMNILFLAYTQLDKSSASPLITPFGTVLGSNNGVEGYSNGNDQITSHLSHKDGDIYYGMKWQCVEYARRWLILSKSLTFTSVDCASDIWHLNNTENITSGSSAPFHRVPNGSKCMPSIGDVLIYKRTQNNPVGHVAIITYVSKDFVWVSEQNWDNDYWPGDYARQIDVDHEEKGYFLKTPDYPILGWMVYEGDVDPQCFDDECKTCTPKDDSANPTCEYL